MNEPSGEEDGAESGGEGAREEQGALEVSGKVGRLRLQQSLIAPPFPEMSVAKLSRRDRLKTRWFVSVSGPWL